MRFSSESEKGFIDRMESTAMSDIIFNLLIFFLLSSSFVVQTGMQIDPPEVVAPMNMELSQVVVTLRPEGDVFVNDQPVTWDQLKGGLEEALANASTKHVVVFGDKEAPLGRAIEVLELGREAGATGFSFATRPKTVER